jgi:thiopurine S-methyltransferase
MEHDFWHRRWHKNEIGFHQETVNPYLLEHWPDLGAGQGSTVFVPLCGKSLDLAWLRSQGHGVVGIELSRVAIEAFFREQRLQVSRQPQGVFERWKADGYRLLCGDFFALSATDLGSIDVVYDRASLIALPPAMRARYATHLRELLPAGLPSLLITVEYPQQEMDGPPFAVQQDEVETLYRGWQPILIARHDILADAKRFRDKGVTQMHESIFRLTSPGPA